MMIYGGVVYLTKVQISQQITTLPLRRYLRSWCCLPNKGTNFSANHNTYAHTNEISVGVVYLTKVQISQQITTTCFAALLFTLVLFT